MDRLLRVTPGDTAPENYAQNTLTSEQVWIVDIEAVEYIEGYKLRLLFSDKSENVVDFEPFLSNSLNPMIRKYLDIEIFKQFTVEHGDLFWNDYDLCFPIADLYRGKI
ncbi:MAG: DUF2442 domain-containing protein [Chloroflexi bacterium]|nr:DUF2442 domain-containing protein [Ardenticatenaceae bacterium]MBL1127394.1 DUF2442 domain-containing protein [Chloroflexota bacterium]NOG33456.1 DUF2442 domain-containing protein [Chloroflexota bacterium]GIK58532.1 MAG: hypothetical protein BroJett015_41950 [Chloroflexota bacterium]